MLRLSPFFSGRDIFNFPNAPLIHGSEAHPRGCCAQANGLTIAGLITGGRVLDWCPPAVLFSPIRSSICCITRLLSGRTSHPHRCTGVRATLLLLSALTTRNNPNDFKKKKKKSLPQRTLTSLIRCYLEPGSRAAAPPRIQAAHLRSNLNVTAPLIESAQVFRWVARNC